MIEVEMLGYDEFAGVGRAQAERSGVSEAEVRTLCTRTAAGLGISDGHLAVSFVDVARITELNGSHRGKHRPTDVLSFPVDEAGPSLGPRELGDVVICPEHTVDLREAIVHGVLHLLGMDHETDAGEMLALQRTLLAEECA